MKKWLIPIVILAIAAISMISFYNNGIEYKENAKTQWSNVESSYQRRADLIPNLVNTVKGYADFEQETLTQVMEARASATKTVIDPTNLTPENVAQFQQAQQGISGALSRLLVAVERYPDLKANQNFLELQSQLEGTENRINVERNRFNESVNKFNKHIQKIPNNIWNNFIGNFDEMGRFEAAEGSDVAPTVNFD